MVPLGISTAASLPSSSAIRRSKASTTAPSPYRPARASGASASAAARRRSAALVLRREPSQRSQPHMISRQSRSAIRRAYYDVATGDRSVRQPLVFATPTVVASDARTSGWSVRWWIPFCEPASSVWPPSAKTSSLGFVAALATNQKRTPPCYGLPRLVQPSSDSGDDLASA